MADRQFPSAPGLVWNAPGSTGITDQPAGLEEDPSIEGVGETGAAASSIVMREDFQTDVRDVR
jgi:hypothetical protein